MTTSYFYSYARSLIQFLGCKNRLLWCRVTLLLIITASIYGCGRMPFTDSETLFTYREVGLCNGEYVGEVHTRERINDCYSLLTTKMTINISPSNQSVTLIEEPLGLNKRLEVIHATATRLQDCRVIDRDNFACDGLERREGRFVSSAALGNRRISSSILARYYAQYTKRPSGFISETALDNFESWWLTVIVSVAVTIMVIGWLTG
jgi:hypothetical protein